MLINDYVILKSNRPRIRAIDNIGPGPMATPFDADSDELEVEHASLTPAERDDLRRDQNTRAVAPVLPMNLIEPTEQSEVDATTLGAVTWGVAATKADVSAFDGNGITVAVLDTGIDPSHPAFTGVTLEQRNFTTEGNNDSHGHGTHCAGTIFGRDVNGLRIGVATGVQRALIGKVLGQGGGNSATIAEAIQWAVNEGAHVISMSLGIDFPGFVDTLVQHHGLAIEPATSIALEGYRANVNMFTELARFVRARGQFAQGSIIVAASGNESNRPEFEIAVAPPAAGTGLLAVGALQKAGGGLQVARFSNNQVDIAAPGVDVVSAKVGGGVQSMSGTSMATPHAAGIAALWGEKMLGQSGGRINPQALVARVISSGSLQTLASGIESEDVGQGLVQAP